MLLLGTVFWPWAFERPLVGPFLALSQFSAFFWNGSVLFAGRVFRAKALPWEYVPTWLAISTPPVLLAGAALSLVRLRRDRWPLAGLWCAALFPAAYVVVRHSTLYNGIRHLLFIVPTLAVLAAAGWTALLSRTSGWRRGLAAAALAAGLVEPALFCLRNHPNEIVYFNALVGGPRGAFGRYDLDYWGNCVLQEVQWADRVARSRGVDAGASPASRRTSSRSTPAATRRSPPRARSRLRHHLEIVPVWGAEAKARRAVTGSDVLHWVSTSDGAVLCVTSKGPRFADVAGRLNVLPR